MTEQSPLQMEVARALITAKSVVLRALLLTERECDIERKLRMRILSWEFEFSTGMLLRRFVGYASPGALNDCERPSLAEIPIAPPPRLDYKPLALDVGTAASLHTSFAQADECLVFAATLLLENPNAWPWTGSTLLNRVCAVGGARETLLAIRDEFALDADRGGKPTGVWTQIAQLSHDNPEAARFLNRWGTLEDSYARYMEPDEEGLPSLQPL